MGNNTKIQEIHENITVLKDDITDSINDIQKVPVLEKCLFEDYLRTFDKFLPNLNPKDKKTFKSNAKGIIKALWADQERFSKKINMANFKF